MAACEGQGSDQGSALPPGAWFLFSGAEMNQGGSINQLACDTHAIGHRQIGVAANLSKAAEILENLSKLMEEGDRDHAAIQTIRDDVAYILRALEVLPASVESLASTLQSATKDVQEAAAISAEAELLRKEVTAWKELHAGHAEAEAAVAQMQALTLQLSQQVVGMNKEILQGGKA